MESLLEKWSAHDIDFQILPAETSQAFSNTETNCISIDWIETVGQILKQVLKRWKAKAISDENKRVLRECHDDGVTKLGVVVRLSDDIPVRKAALTLLLDLLPQQARTISSNGKFPLLHFAEALKSVVLIGGPIADLLEVLKEYLRYPDVAFYLWKALEFLIYDTTLTLSDRVVENVVRIINLHEKTETRQHIEDPADPDTDKKTQYLVSHQGIGDKKAESVSVKKLWDRLMSCELAPLTKQMLVVALIEHIMPRIQKPIFLTDYFMACLNEGGAISLLGLQGIFVLIQKHNINYPNVYGKLYSLLNVDIFSTPYKARFFYLSDIFLTSSHLPEATIAGFVKKLARLALMAPPPDIVIIMAFITNLIIRHPGLKKLMHRATPQNVKSDPYQFDEVDASKSGAIQSSLWEVKLLQHHVLPSVAASAMFINNPLPSVEIDLANLLDVNTSKIFDREYKKKMKETPVSFERPTSMLVPRSETGAFALWSLTS